MTLPPELYGPFGALVILAIGIVAIVRAFLTGSIVPGFIYRKSEERRDAAETKVVELTKTLADLALVKASGLPDGPPEHG